MSASTPPSSFSNLRIVPLDPHYTLKQLFAADEHENKVILGSGIYRDDDSQPWVLPTIKKAEEYIDKTQDSSRYEYLPITGYAPFHNAARNLLFGSLGSTKADQTVSVHTLAGTGANSLGARFLKEALNPSAVWFSDPTWVNHLNIWSLAGVQIKTYPYWNAEKRGLDFDSLVQTLEANAKKGMSLYYMHALIIRRGLIRVKSSGRLSQICVRRRAFFLFFDCAYLGFASGNLDNDAWAVRHFLSRATLEFAVAQSFSKNMGLYGERVGAFHLYASSAEAATKAQAQLERLQRGQISTPPARGARIAATILSTPGLYREWLLDLQEMTSRIKGMRRLLREQLISLGTPGNWDHIQSQIGMFSYTGLTPEQVDIMQADDHVYILKTGRISIAGLTTANVVHVAKAIDAAVRKSPKYI